MERRTSVQMDKRKINLCVHIRKKYFGEDARSSTGMCMIVFAIPLLIPGIVITTVAFEDETGFSRFSALHVFGMVLLAADFLLLIAGIALCVRFQSKVAPDDAFQAISTHKKIRKDVNLDTDATMSPNEATHKGTEFSTPCFPSIPPVNYFLDKGSNTKHEHGALAAPAFSSIYKKDVTEHGYSKTSLEDDSSSYESDDSDCSSGSYIIPENVIQGRTPQGMASACDLTKVPNVDFSLRDITDTSAQSGSNNHFQSSTEDSIPDVKQKVNNKVQHSIQHATLLETHHETKQHEISVHLNESELIPAHASIKVEQDSDIHNTNFSPMSRRRLLGFSSENVLTSPKTPVDSDIALVPSQVAFTQHALSLEEDCTGSRTSVFSVATEIKELRNKQQNSIGKKDTLTWYTDLNQNISLSNSPYAARPISFPSRDSFTRSDNFSTGTKQFPSQKQPARSVLTANVHVAL